MATPDGAPLLVLSHAEDGRVAQLNSDSAWLWGRGWDGGGPQAELLRRLAHWLMKEPALDENQLSGQALDGKLRVERRSLDGGDRAVDVTRPDGSHTSLHLSDQGNGLASGAVTADQTGLWRINDDQLTTLVAVGSQDPLEMDDVRATPERLKEAVGKNGGGIFWMEDGLPGLSRPAADTQMAGSGWMGLRANGQHSVTATSRQALLPGWLLLALVAGGLALGWWRDARR